MYRFYINNIEDEYHYMELARVFLPDDAFEIIPYSGSLIPELPGSHSYFVNSSCSNDRDEIKREFYKMLSDITGYKPPWGTLTGVRPLKPALDICENTYAADSSKSSIDVMKMEIKSKYLMSEDKAALIADIATYQLDNITDKGSDKASVYVGIPFCPTRCAYCSFASNIAPDEDHRAYLEDLIKEILYMGKLAKSHKTSIESIYIGGGTPTTLNADQLSRLIGCISESFDTDPSSIEFTVEAGRPDTIDKEKLTAIKRAGVSRISINPQSMKDETLRLIGRDHNADDIRRAYSIAADVGFDVINADLIAGLPEEDASDFEKSLDEIIKLGANNITVHTLSVKRGSRLKDNDPEYYRRNIITVGEMLDISRQMLGNAGFAPYYIYRQKHQIGAFENTGYCVPGKHSLYNIRIMDDRQTIIGLGAGAVGKVYYPEEHRLERIANVSNYKIYSERFDEMLARKELYYK